MRRNLPPHELFVGLRIPTYPDHVIKRHVDSGNNGHLYEAFDETTNSRLAFKVVPLPNLPDGQDAAYVEEARNANLLDHPSVVRYHNVVACSPPETPIACVVFVCDFVNGISLRKYVERRALRREIDVSFVIEFLSTMFGLLFELDRRGYRHGDLHAGNVLVVRSDFDIDSRPRFRVTDFGVTPRQGSGAHADDYLQTAESLAQLLQCVDYTTASGRDRFIFEVLRDQFLARHLIETDKTIDPLAGDAQALYDRLATLDREYADAASQDRNVTELLTPFDYPNCEQIGDSHLLLKALYSERLLGLSEINARSNIVLTGPRGCGKTMVFRALSLDYRMSTGSDLPADLPYIGVYYRCDDLYFCFPRYQRPTRVAAFDIPMHYVTSTLLGLALEHLGRWSEKHFAEEWARAVPLLIDELWELFGWDRPSSPGYHRLAAIVNRLKGRERRRARNKQRFAHVDSEPIEGYFGPDVLSAACQILRSRLTYLRDRPFYFFIDDYSRPKISEPLQANLNRLFMHRSSEAFFKVSTESPVSFTRHDIDGKAFAETREFDFINLGIRYVTGRKERIVDFIVDLFDRRFGLVPAYPAESLHTLLGSAPRNENAAARAFRGDAQEDKTAAEYAGIETIASMCSGDVHYIIGLVARMVDDFGGVEGLRRSESTPIIPTRVQNRSIRAAAGAFMDSIRIVPDSGPRLAEVVSAFGNVARSYLVHKTSRNKRNVQPHQASRIEPYEALELTPEATEILHELLRYSVFISDPRGKSRRGQVVPRFYLRRYLIPHFGLTFSQRDSVEVEPREVELLLQSPKVFEDKHRLRGGNRESTDQKDLF